MSRTLEERLEQGNASAWRPDQEDPALLVGKVVDIDIGESEYQGAYPIVTVLKDDGEEKAVHGFHTVLKNELMKKRPQIGERIGIKYFGETETKPGSKFKSFIKYEVRVDRQSGSFNWASLGGPLPEEQVHDPYAVVPAEATPVAVPADAGDDEIPF